MSIFQDLDKEMLTAKIRLLEERLNDKKAVLVEKVSERTWEKFADICEAEVCIDCALTLFLQKGATDCPENLCSDVIVEISFPLVLFKNL